MIIARPDRWQSARTGVAVFNINRKIDFGSWTVWKCHKWNRMLTPVTMYIRAVVVALFRKPNHQLLWTNPMKMPKIARSDPWQSTRRLSIKRNTGVCPFSGWTVWKLQKWNRALKTVTMWMRARRSRAFQGTEPPISLQPHPTLTSIVLEIFRPPRFPFPCFQLFVPCPVFVHLDFIFHGAPRGYVVN